jgi:hypothetical protein
LERANSGGDLVTIHTPASLRTSRVDRRITKAELVIRALQNGCSLHQQFTPNGRRWTLSDGRSVSDETAELVTGSSSVMPVGDTLFRETMSLSQTWRWWSNE